MPRRRAISLVECPEAISDTICAWRGDRCTLRRSLLSSRLPIAGTPSPLTVERDSYSSASCSALKGRAFRGQLFPRLVAVRIAWHGHRVGASMSAAVVAVAQAIPAVGQGTLAVALVW